MSRVFFLDSDELAGQSPTIAGAAEELAAALHNLETVLGTEGRCWGNDEPGKVFEQTYDSDAKQTVVNLRNLVGTLRSSGQSFKDIGNVFNNMDTDAGRRVRGHESPSETTAFSPAGSPGSNYPASRPNTVSPLSGIDSKSPNGQRPHSESPVGSEQGQRGSRPPAADDTTGNMPGSGAVAPSGPSGEPPQSPSVRDAASAAGAVEDGAVEDGAGLVTGDPPSGATIAQAAQTMPPASLDNASSGAETAGPAPSSPWSRPSERPGPGGQSPGSQSGQPSGNPPGTRSSAQPQGSRAKQQRRERKKDNKQQKRPPEVAASENADRPPAVPTRPTDRTRPSGGSRRYSTPWSKPEPVEPAETTRADGSKIGH